MAMSAAASATTSKRTITAVTQQLFDLTGIVVVFVYGGQQQQRIRCRGAGEK
jgi:hypothetical protein